MRTLNGSNGAFSVIVIHKYDMKPSKKAKENNRIGVEIINTINLPPVWLISLT